MNDKIQVATHALGAWLETSRKIVLLSHQNPDGDAIGSLLAFYIYLKGRGHQVDVIVPNDFPEFLQWLPCAKSIIVHKKQKKLAAEKIASADTLVHLDFNDIRRLKELEPLLGQAQGLKVLIDHHPDPQVNAEISISCIEVSSTAELVYHVIDQISGTSAIDLDMATCIYTGIMTDTGCFSYNSSSPLTFEVVGSLLTKGIDKNMIYGNVYNTFSADRMKLLGYCLNEKMIVLPDLKTAYMSLTIEEQKRFNFAPGDSEGFVNFPLSIKGVNFTVLFIEKCDLVKISLRSRGDFSANQFSRDIFGGGGHRNAAGGESRIGLEKTIELFLNALPGYKEDLNSY